MSTNTPKLVRSRLSAALFAAMLLPAAGAVLAQDQNVSADQNPAQDQQDQATTQQKAKNLDRILVTGSLIPTSQLETATPVTTITAEDIQARGFTSVTDALSKSTFSTGAVQGAQSSASFTQGAETISMFGLSPSYVKYLIDGRPMANYPALYNGSDTFNNISGIPIDLVDRIEILPGGQSSLYGSDAIAGVINIILKKKFEGTVLNVRGGWYSEGGGNSTRFSLAHGFTAADGRFTGLAGIQYSERDPIWAYQRDLTRQYFRESEVSPPLASRDYLVYSPFTSYNFMDPNNCANVTGQFGGTEGLQTRPRFGDTHYCGSFFTPGYRTLLNEKKGTQVYGHGTFDVNDNVQLYGDVLYNKEKVKYHVGSNYTWWGTGVKWGYFYDPNLDDFLNLQRAFAPEDMGPGGFRNSMSYDDSKSYAVTFGAQGTFGGSNWDYDIGVTRTQYDLDETSWVRFADPINDYFQNKVLGPQLGLDPYYGAYPVFEPNYAAFYTPMSQQDFESFSGFATSKSKTWDNMIRGQITNTALFGLPGGDAGIAVALEAAKQSWEYNPDPGFLNGDIWGQTAVAGGGDRTRYALTTELRMPVTKMLTATVSGRYDSFKTSQDTISKPTYSLGLEFRPLETLLFRGKYGTAFKAPTLSDLFQGISGYYSFVTDYYNCSLAGYDPTQVDNCPGALSNRQFFGTQAGNPNLDPINAKVWSAGAVWAPIDRMSLSVDYLHWDIRDEVTQQSANGLTLQEYRCRTGLDDINSALCQATLSQITRNAAGFITEIFTPKINVSRETVNAITAAANYQFDVGNWGTMNVRGSYTQNLKHDYVQYAGDDVIDLLDDPYWSTDPKRKAELSVGWAKDKVNATMYANWFGKTPNYRSFVSTLRYDDPLGAKLPSHITWNLSLGYQPIPQLQLSLLVNNLFNKMPPMDYTYPGSSGAPYNSSNFDVYGRAMYLEMRYSFGANED